jgi:hypothetical protein
MNSATLLFLTLAFAPTPPELHTDYYDAWDAARGRKLLLIDFGSGFDFTRIEPRLLSEYVVCRVPADYVIEGDDAPRRLLDCGAFRALEGQSGLAIVDLKHDRRPDIFKKTVSVLPRRHVTQHKVRELLRLPPGTLTQRTLVWALRVHPQRPRSVYGYPDPVLMAHCRNHCGVQCAANNQHHAAGNPGRSEIVAESWPWNKNIVDAAIDIVWSWSCSSGHWGAACRTWSAYGYDMHTNGQKWYATGVFR